MKKKIVKKNESADCFLKTCKFFKNYLTVLSLSFSKFSFSKTTRNLLEYAISLQKYIIQNL